MSIIRVWAVVPLAALLTAALTGCSSSTSAASPKIPVPPGLAAHPATMTIAGKTYTRVGESIEPDSVSAPSISSRQLELSYAVVSGTSTLSTPLCGTPKRPFGYVIRQDAGVVTVGIGGYYPYPVTGGKGAYGCTGLMSGHRTLSLRLAAPLGHRSVRNGSTGSTVLLTVGQPR